jgi:3D (Asp-Asp-Asp) domain-containing protein
MKKIFIFLTIFLLSFISFSKDDPFGGVGDFCLNYQDPGIITDFDGQYYKFWQVVCTNEMKEYRWYNQDFGWSFDLSNLNIMEVCPNPIQAIIPSGSTLDENEHVLTRVQLDISLKKPQNINPKIGIWAYDVDYPDEKDLIFIDGEPFRNLFGYGSMFFTDTIEDIPPQFLEDKKLDIFIDIDSEHDENYWGVQIAQSHIEADIGTTPSLGKTFNIFSRSYFCYGYCDYDTITQPSPIDNNGNYRAYIEIRNQECHDCGDYYRYNNWQIMNYVVSDENEGVLLYDECYITNRNSYLCPREYQNYIRNSKIFYWFPARYEQKFYVTCYYTPLETDFSDHCRNSKSYKWCEGYTPPSDCYSGKFMEAVEHQGSGKAKNGEIIQYRDNKKNPGKSCYYTSSCPKTSSGFCAQVNSTVAIDRDDTKVVPFMSTLNIEGFPYTYVANDAGGSKIVGYDIDVYYGIGSGVCNGFPTGYKSVTFLRYH